MAGDCRGAEIRIDVMNDGQQKNSGDVRGEESFTGLQYVTLKARGDEVGRMGEIVDRWRRRARIMLVFGEHGRELIGGEIAYGLLKGICKENNERSTEMMDAFSGLNNGVELVIVPIANIAGRKLVEMGRKCDMTNANDVDLVRNWDSHWDGQGSYGSFERNAVDGNEYRSPADVSVGSRPFSEAETRALRNIARKARPTAYVSVRSGGLSMIPPWDCDKDVLPRATEKRFQQVSERVAALFCTQCKIQSRPSPLCGTGVDYMFGNLGTPFAYTWQVYQDSKATRTDCFRYYNPTTREGYKNTVRIWSLAVMELAKTIHRWLAIERSQGEESASKDAFTSTLYAKEAQAKARLKEAETEGRGVKSGLHKLGREAKKIQLWPRQNGGVSEDNDSSFGLEDAFVFFGLLAGGGVLVLMMFFLRRSLIKPKLRKSRYNTTGPLKWA